MITKEEKDLVKKIMEEHDELLKSLS